MEEGVSCPPAVERLLVLVDVLRHRGVAVGTGDIVDATRALGVLDLMDRNVLRRALSSILVRREADLSTFDSAFDVVFSLQAPGVPEPPGEESVGTDAKDGSPAAAIAASAAHGGDDPGELAAAVSTAAAAGDAEAMSELAARAVALFEGDGDASPRRVMYQVMRAMDLANMLSAVLRRLRADETIDALELSLRRREAARALEAFRRALAAEIDRMHERRALEGGSVADLPLPAVQRPVVEMTVTELRDLRRTLQPLARQLAAHVGRRRRPRPTGRLDMRRTIRRSLQSGGIPIDPATRRRHPQRPDVVVLCDISGSVAEFAQFTLTLVHAVHDVLADVRSFAFVDGVAETTEVFADAIYDIPVARLLERPGVIGLDGHSDYGAVFRQFAAEHLDRVGSRTTVLVTGDGRSNFRDPGIDAFGSIAERARRVYWLDPEPRPDWGLDDSAIPDYAPLCDGVFEVATVSALADVIGELV
jgi:uncharacterized protein with von Willebrand factor type A (vWA) domain